MNYLRRVLLACCLCISSAACALTDTVTVSLSRANLCVRGVCVPTIIGTPTPLGVYPITHVRIRAPGYGGDVLVFLQRPGRVPLSIHRVWLGRPSERRLERLRGPIAGRLGVSGGCINVEDVVYAWLEDCCSRGTLSVVP